MSRWQVVLVILLACPQAWAQEETAVEEADSSSWVWYVIRPGDTLEGLTIRYLGSRDRWRENAELNLELFPDPHSIKPGARIKLLSPTEFPPAGAVVKELSNHVEDQPTPLAWIDARKRDLLRARDRVKTHEQSSAELEFADGTLLLLTELSSVVINETTVQAPVDRTQIEIVVGQADLEGSIAAADDDGLFDIVLGDATATPLADDDGAVSTRARRPEGGGAQLMVYSGESELEAAGAKVTVATGMGSSVPEGKAPKPPEELLPAPVDLEPAAGADLATPRPMFTWTPVGGARGYTLEVCRDPRCGALVERVAELADPSWKPAGLPVEELYWRVTALSPSGLDGYPSDPVGFTITSAVEDTEPPEIRISFTGPQLAPRSGLNDRWILGPGMEVEVEVEDGVSGVRQWAPMIDDEEIARERLKGPWVRGEHAVAVFAADRAGNSRRVEVPFIYDPDPPELSWGVEGSGALGSTAGEPSDALAGPARPRRGRREVKIGRRRWQLDSDMAEVLVRPQGGKPIGLNGLDGRAKGAQADGRAEGAQADGRAEGAQAEEAGAIDSDQGLWVLAQDAVCSELDVLTYELVPGPRKKEYALRIEAIDCVGNRRRAQLPLVRQE